MTEFLTSWNSQIILCRSWLCLVMLAASPVSAIERHKDFDVVIAGGSTAAFAAAVTAAQEGASVALLEPTDWVGGQLTSSGVPAVDEAWHKLTNQQNEVVLDVAGIARTPANISPLLRDMLDRTGCPGKCWVSRFCFEPRNLIDQHLTPLEAQASNLTIFRETVVKRVETTEDRIVSVLAITRRPKATTYSSGYDVLPSEDVSDWYSPDESPRFTKELHRFDGERVVFIDATEWGELLALSDAPYLIGVESSPTSIEGDDTLGQSITYGFVQELHDSTDSTRDSDVPDPDIPSLGYGDYKNRENRWKLIWTYRRLRASEQAPAAGDLSLQNWGYSPSMKEGGNDYPFGYFFLNRSDTEAQRQDWLGGVDFDVMRAAEQRAFAWHRWFKEHAPEDVDSNRISLSKAVLGTGHGLSKLPYIRDTRRSIGIDGFVLRMEDLAPTGEGKLATTFDDRIALGAYPVDVAGPFASSRS